MKRNIAISVGLCLATLLVYWPVGDYAFINLDDPIDVGHNPHVTTGLTWGNVAWAFTSTDGCNWMPLTRLSHMAACEAFGPSAAGWHHRVNVALHVAAAVLLYLVLRRMTAAAWPSAVAAALFALHPLHVESVAWVTERKDVLSTVFWMLALGAYARYAARPSVGRYVLVFGLLGLGLMAKPMLVTLPFVMLLLDWWPLGRLGVAGVPRPVLAGRAEEAAASDTAGQGPPWHTMVRLVLEKLPLLALVATASVVTYVVQQRGGAMEFAQALPFPTRLAGAMTAYAGYLGQTFWPAGLAFFYPYVDRPAWQAALAAALLVAVSALALWQARRRPYLAVGWFWYLGTLVPVIGLVQIGNQAMADRYTYVPIIGIFIAVAWAAADLAATWRHRLKVLVPAAAGVLAACAVLTTLQVRHWSSTEAVCHHAIAVTADNAFAHSNLGLELTAQGRFAEALPHFQEVLRIEPRFKTVHFDLGTTLAALGRFDEAIMRLRQAVRMNPTDVQAVSNLAALLDNAGSQEEAMALYGEALRLDPDNADSLNNLGVALTERGQAEEAIRRFRRILAKNPKHVFAHSNLGMALAKAGRAQEAAAEYREALALRPNWPEALNRLARLRATFADPRFRNGAESVALAAQACRLTRRANADYLDTLAAACAETGRFADAVAVAEEARTLAASQGNKALAAAIDLRLALYRTGQPYHEAVAVPPQVNP